MTIEANKEILWGCVNRLKWDKRVLPSGSREAISTDHFGSDGYWVLSMLDLVVDSPDNVHYELQNVVNGKGKETKTTGHYSKGQIAFTHSSFPAILIGLRTAYRWKP